LLYYIYVYHRLFNISAAVL